MRSWRAEESCRGRGRLCPPSPRCPYSPHGLSPPHAQSQFPRGVGSALHARSALRAGPVSSVRTHPAPPLISPPPSSQPPDPTIEHGHHCNLQQGLQRGLQWYQLGAGRQEVRAVRRDGLAFTALPRPQPCACAPPSQLTASDSSADWFE